MTARRWRPSLAFVLGGALCGTLGLSLAGLVTLRWLGPHLGYANAAAVLGLAILLATAALGWLLVRLLLRPIRALEAFALSVEQNRAPAPPVHFGTQELHATARRIIAMANALRDREATIRAFTDHVTHEVKTPVAAIHAAVELLQDGPLSPQDAQLVAQIDGAQAQIQVQLAALRQAAQAREARYLGQTTLADLAPTLTADFPSLTLGIEGGTHALPMAAPGLLVVLRQLLANSSGHGASHITLAAAPQPEALLLTVADNGPGISPGNVARLFDPFFTTRRDQGGTGMGLTIARNLLAAHNAGIEAAASDTGALFRLTFPVA